MEKYLNSFSVMGGVVVGIAYYLFGGFDVMLKGLVAFATIDYITGLACAVYTKQLSSRIGASGIMKKAAMFMIVAVANVARFIIGDAIPIREITIMFYICNEALSILENAATLNLPIPGRLKKTLIQLRENTEKEESEEL